MMTKLMRKRLVFLALVVLVGGCVFLAVHNRQYQIPPPTLALVSNAAGDFVVVAEDGGAAGVLTAVNVPRTPGYYLAAEDCYLLPNGVKRYEKAAFYQLTSAEEVLAFAEREVIAPEIFAPFAASYGGDIGDRPVALSVFVRESAGACYGLIVEEMASGKEQRVVTNWGAECLQEKGLVYEDLGESLWEQFRQILRSERGADTWVAAEKVVLKCYQFVQQGSKVLLVESQGVTLDLHSKYWVKVAPAGYEGRIAEKAVARGILPRGESFEVLSARCAAEETLGLVRQEDAGQWLGPRRLMYALLLHA